jgi:hypothetical protein
VSLKNLSLQNYSNYDTSICGVVDQSGADVSNLERLESVKAGVLGAITFIIPYFITLRLNDVLWEYTPIPLVTLGLKLAIALISGFLFGVTYRYIIRNETNSHLKDGAVFAFGLIRGLVPLEMSSQVWESLGEISLLGIESIVCFAIVRFSLDFALYRHWIKPFSS